MNSRKLLLLVLLVVGAFGVAVWQPWVSEERRIDNLIDEMLAELEIKTPEHPLERAAKAKKLSQNFIDPLEISVGIDGEEVREFRSRKEVEQSILALRSQLSSLELAVLRREIQVSGVRAEFRGEAKILGAMPGVEGKFLEQPLIQLELQKHDGRWFIQWGFVRAEESR